MTNLNLANYLQQSIKFCDIQEMHFYEKRFGIVFTIEEVRKGFTTNPPPIIIGIT